MVKKFVIWSAVLALTSLFLANGRAVASGLKMPDVPVTGGKKAHISKDGNVISVQPMPGISASKEISWEDLTKLHYNLRHMLPPPRPQELIVNKGLVHQTTRTTVDLPVVMKRYAVKDFSEPKYGAKEEWVKSFGNIIAEFKAVKGNPRRTDDLLDRLEKHYPVIYRELAPYLPQLVRDDFLYSNKWDPYKDESIKGKQNDGILFIDHWVMRPNPTRAPRWNQNIEEHKVYQGAIILYADVPTIKEMEKDYANYFSQVGQDYLEVYPIQNSYFHGIDPQGNEFLRGEVFLRNDLPFPYPTCAYVMNILEHYNEDGNLVSEYYSDDRNDLNWMAGRDTYFPITTTKGEFVGNLIVTNLDFDIKNVPERDIDRIISMKAGLGNMKRIAEARAEKKGASASR